MDLPVLARVALDAYRLDILEIGGAEVVFGVCLGLGLRCVSSVRRGTNMWGMGRTIQGPLGVANSLSLSLEVEERDIVWGIKLTWGEYSSSILPSYSDSVREQMHLTRIQYRGRRVKHLGVSCTRLPSFALKSASRAAYPGGDFARSHGHQVA